MGKQEGSGIRLIDALPEDGERRLMLAVLMDAIRILRQYASGPRCAGYRDWVQELQWLHSEEHQQPFAFVSICNALGIDPAYVRRCVLVREAAPLPMKGRRYAATTEESWRRLKGPRRSITVSAPTATAAASTQVENESDEALGATKGALLHLAPCGF